MDSPTGNISLADARSITENRMVKNSTKLSFGDNYKGFKIVGTEESFLELYNCKFENGKVWKESLEAVVGKKASEILDLKIGDEFTSTHGLGDYGESHEDSVFKVVGILEHSGSVADQLILTSLESVWDIHKEHDHDMMKNTTMTMMKNTTMTMMKNTTMTMMKNTTMTMMKNTTMTMMKNTTMTMMKNTTMTMMKNTTMTMMKNTTMTMMKNTTMG